MKYTLPKSFFHKDRRQSGFVLRSILVVSTLVFTVIVWSFWNQSTTWYGYVVGEDRRIYMVDLKEGVLEWVSDELDQIGNPTEIDLNQEDSILYIASGPEGLGTRGDYVPLVAVSLDEKPEIILESWVDPEHVKGSNTKHAIYYLRLSPNSDVIYAAYANLDHQRRTILDASNAEIIDQNSIFITKADEFSPDATKLAQIHPGLNEETEFGVRDFPGIVIVWDLETGEQILRTEHEGNKNLYPPWESPEDHFVHVRRNRKFNRLEVYDRGSGEQLAVHEYRKSFGLGSPTQRNHATKIPGSDNVAMTFGSYVVVFDPITAEIKSQTYVSDSILTEVVVTDKPLLRTDITSVERAAEQ